MTTMRVYFRELWEGRRHHVCDHLLLSVLRVLAIPYSLAMRVRSFLYTMGFFRSHRLAKPVISVGNLSVGGTGKTPMVALLARKLLARGVRVAVLSRGYGGTAEGAVHVVSDGTNIFLPAEVSGDEPYLLASSVPGLIVVIGSDRYRAGMLAIHRFDPDILILDDGFQHLRLKRDLNILLLDGKNPFGNGMVLPAGLLRESRSAVSRADVIVFTRCEGAKHPYELSRRPTLRSSHRLVGIIHPPKNDVEPFSSLEGKRIIAFAGIAEPEYFFAALRHAGLQLLDTVTFPDHCDYSKDDIALLCSLRDAKGAGCFVTTEKDAVKLRPFRELDDAVWLARMDLEIDSEDILWDEIEKLL